MASDILGNVFVAGTFGSTVIDFSSVSLTNTTSSQGNFLCRYDASGNLLWSQLVGTNSGNRPLAVAVGTSTNVWVAGYLSGTARFGTNVLVSSGPLAIFIAKYDVAGQVLWARKIEAYDPATFNPFGFTVAPDGSAFLSSRCNGTADFGGVSLTNTTAFLAKYDSGGVLGYAVPALAANAIAVSRNGSIFLTGPSLLARYDSAGGLMWSRPFPTGTALAVDVLDNVYAAGYGSGTYDGLVLTNSAGLPDFFLAKCNPAGAFQWLRQIGGTRQERGAAVAVNRYGNIYVAGFSATASPEPKLIFGGSTLTNALWFVAKYDVSGQPQWAKSSSSSVRATAFGLASAEPDSVLLCGAFYNTTTFDGVTLSESATWGAGAAYVAKLETGESPLIPVLNFVAQRSDGHIEFTVTGAAGMKYAVESSTNLNEWSGHLTNASPFLFVDSDPASFLRRFYRAVLVP